MTTAVAVRPEQRREQDALQALNREIDSRRATLEASAASLIDPQRLKGVVLAAFTRTPGLWECDPITVARAVVESAQYGLEPTGAIGGAHLVPFRNKRTGKKEAQLIIDYRGYIQLARRSGEVSKVWARTVRERDEFWVEAGSEDRIHHRPYLGSEDPGKYTHVYAVIQYKDGAQQFDWDTWAWVQTIRKRSKASDDGPWVTDEPEMAKKSILRRVLKTSPLTIEAKRAIEFEEQSEAETAQHRSGRPSVAVSRIHERLGIAEGSEDEPAQDAPSAPETPEPVSASAPEAGESVCGALSDAALGDVVTCVLDPGHATPDGKPSAHTAADGSKFPNGVRA